ncbi:hypothetical protein [Natronorubrum texcoconense]|uniref:Uncharacterized protein n=1 Tax=Natronorubrum texcoconense TaxID=1095776 RepID=A0A1G9A1C0_9EURY|nr:hypothetical protein [Natronorubrum texcoconense]SDK21162.1 hypothetical protein SAMN04515672_2541 [Natronorubrum texcoconense]
MTESSRRTLLCAGAGLLSLSAGCLDEFGSSTSEDTPTDDDDSDGNDPESGDNETESTATGDLETTANVRFDHADVPMEPEATLVTSADRADRWLDDHEFVDDVIPEFVEETLFEESVLLALESDAPNLCYKMALEDVTLEETDDSDDGDAQLSLEAAVIDESEDDELCGQQMIAVGQLVRATFDGEPATSASVTIDDADGETHELSIDVESDSDES